MKGNTLKSSLPSGQHARGTIRWLVVALYAGAIYLASALPGEAIPALGVSDKLLHAAEYAGFTVLLCRALHAQFPARSLRAMALISMLIAVGYGVTDEVHQLWTAHRVSDLADLAADGIGACLAAWGWQFSAARWPWLR